MRDLPFSFRAADVMYLRRCPVRGMSTGAGASAMIRHRLHSNFFARAHSAPLPAKPGQHQIQFLVDPILLLLTFCLLGLNLFL